MTSQRRTKFWISVVAILLTAQMMACALIAKGFALIVVTDSISLMLTLCPILITAFNAAHRGGRIRLFWILQSVGWMLWLADQSLWFIFDIVLRRSVPLLFVGDSLLFLAAIPMLAGLLLRPHSQPSEQDSKLSALDFLLLMIWGIYLYVFFVLCWQYASPNVALYNRSYDALYEVAEAVLLGTSALLWWFSSSDWKTFYGRFSLAILFNSLSFYIVNHAIETGIYFSGSSYDLPFTASLTGFSAILLLGRDLRRDSEASPQDRYFSGMEILAILALLSVPIMAVWAIADRDIPPQVSRFRVLFSLATVGVMAFLIFLKQRRLHAELKVSNQVLEEASLTDPLTGVRNRRYFTASIVGDIQQALRSYADHHDPRTRDLVFYLIDVDNFKSVNDDYGHDAGDRVLVEMSRRISGAIRNSDVLVRWGGEEFLIVSRYTDRREAETLAARVLEAVNEAPYFTARTSAPVAQTCSVGWAAFPWIPDALEAVGYQEVLNFADLALQQAKRRGKNRAIGAFPSTLPVAAAGAVVRVPQFSSGNLSCLETEIHSD